MKSPLILLLLTVCLAAQTSVAPRVYRVDGHIYRGRQPNRAEFSGLDRMGIRTVLDLRGGAIHQPGERKEVEALGMQYTSMRLSGNAP